MKILKTLLIGSLFGFTLAHAQVGRNTAEYNLSAGTGLGSFDPVAVFAEGGGQALRGSTAQRLQHEGVAYLFANNANQETFQQAPEKYEPTYGGWCAYAMASGSKVPIQATIFTIHGNRAHYFVSNAAKRAFDRDVASFESRADTHWKRISGEEPRRR